MHTFVSVSVGEGVEWMTPCWSLGQNGFNNIYVFDCTVLNVTRKFVEIPQPLQKPVES